MEDLKWCPVSKAFAGTGVQLLGDGFALLLGEFRHARDFQPKTARRSCAPTVKSNFLAIVRYDGCSAWN
jgi:hypothetical protein